MDFKKDEEKVCEDTFHNVGLQIPTGRGSMYFFFESAIWPKTGMFQQLAVREEEYNLSSRQADLSVLYIWNV